MLRPSVRFSRGWMVDVSSYKLAPVQADLLLSYGYEEDLKQLAQQVPRRCQCLLMSATTRCVPGGFAHWSGLVGGESWWNCARIKVFIRRGSALCVLAFVAGAFAPYMSTIRNSLLQGSFTFLGTPGAAGTTESLFVSRPVRAQ